MTQKALKLALDALEKAYHAMQTDMAQDQIEEAITAIKEALREHAMREVQRLGQEIEQEPIGTVKELFTQTAWERLDLRGSTKVYLNTTPPQCTWVDLTSEEYDEIWRMDLNNKDIMDKTISKLKEKNT